MTGKDNFKVFVGLVLLAFSACTLQPRPDGSEDWLVYPMDTPVVVSEEPESHQISLSNGLIKRTFRLSPNAATVAFDNLMTGESLLRGIKPEATVTLDEKTYEVGGLKGQTNYAYLLPDEVHRLTSAAEAFQFAGYETGPTSARFAWGKKRSSQDRPWPPPGRSLVLRFRSPQASLQGIEIAIHYEMYAGIPLLSKWLTITNSSPNPVTLNTYTSEILAAVEGSSAVESSKGMRLPNMFVECDYEFLGMTAAGANKAVFWDIDPEYLTQVSYRRLTPCLLQVRPPLGPEAEISVGDTFESFRTYELVYDSTERERQGLAVRRMYRTIAPWVTENPLMLHVRHADPATVRNAIDQCAEVGFEMVILTFGSGFNIENEDPGYIAQIKELVDYAHTQGIELGGYSLLASRRISDEHDVINPETGKPGGFAAFGNSPCLGSEWGQDYFRKLYAFFEKTGFDLLEHDGSYPGDVCASTHHPGHNGLKDSQYKQWKTITDFYKWCRGRGVYLNVPDFYYLSGSNKCGMGYRETNWSLPRDQQVIHTRQNIYDGTWLKTPSMGWMFVPLTEYHGGGAAATIEPLHEHLEHYELMLASNLGFGVQACYRGPRLYDTEETKALVKKWVNFYKEHREILESDLIHLRRADGRDLDYMLHVNPQLEEKGLLMIFNPLDQTISKTIRVPLYYTGLTEWAKFREENEDVTTHKLDRQYCVFVPVKVPPKGITWFIIE
jgi:hypothetical protein